VAGQGVMVQALQDLPQPLDRLIGLGDPGAPALADRSGTLTYTEVDRAVGVLAGTLQALGLAPGDRVASWLAKTRIACLMPLATARAGLIHVPINPLLKRAQVAHILWDSGSRLLIGGEARLATLDSQDVPDDCRLIDETAINRDGGEVMTSFRQSADEIAAILYTSGSTGRPKGVVLSHANLWLGAIAVQRYLRLTAGDRTLCVLPLSFDYGQNQLLSTWAAGGCVVPFDYILPKDVVRAVDRFQISVLAGVPPLWSQLAEVAWPDETSGRLRILTNSGGRLPVPLVRMLRGLFPNAKLHSMYGLTEAFRSTSLAPELIDAHPESIGTAIPFAEILVVRPDGTLANDDEAGELVHAGPLVAKGYWNDGERTAHRFRPAPAASHYGGTAVWSGDKVLRGADGLLRFVGRDDEMIKTSGNRVSPTEIEEAAIGSGVVNEAVAWGVADEVLGQAIVLAVSGRHGEEAVLRHHLKHELPSFMQPRDIAWREQLPRNANGKLDRVRIKAEHDA